MNVAVVEYPGSTCVCETVYAYSQLRGHSVNTVWHEQDSFGDVKPDLVVLPGGYSFGDHLRPGALAKGSPASAMVRKFSQDGGRVIGIGNGFQILCELGVLPGVLLVNPHMGFYGKDAFIKVENTKSEFSKNAPSDRPLVLPLASYYARFYTDRRTLKDLETSGCVVLRYCDKFGDSNPARPFLGSTHSIAGIVNKAGNVFGLMPHPERACEAIFGSTDGVHLLGA